METSRFWFKNRIWLVDFRTERYKGIGTSTSELKKNRLLMRWKQTSPSFHVCSLEHLAKGYFNVELLPLDKLTLKNLNRSVKFKNSNYLVDKFRRGMVFFRGCIFFIFICRFFMGVFFSYLAFGGVRASFLFSPLSFFRGFPRSVFVVDFTVGFCAGLFFTVWRLVSFGLECMV